jgi:hypothetical protein
MVAIVDSQSQLSRDECCPCRSLSPLGPIYISIFDSLGSHQGHSAICSIQDEMKIDKVYF